MRDQETDGRSKRRRLTSAYMLAAFLGMFGAHWFYLGRPAAGCNRLSLTLIGLVATLAGVSGFVFPEVTWIYVIVSLATIACWVVLDAFLIPSMVRRYNLKIRSESPGEVDPVDESGQPFYGAPERPTKASVGGAYLRWVFLGAFGAHRYHLGSTSASTLCAITGVHVVAAIVAAVGGGGPAGGFTIAGGAALALALCRVLLDLFKLRQHVEPRSPPG